MLPERRGRRKWHLPEADAVLVTVDCLDVVGAGRGKVRESRPTGKQPASRVGLPKGREPALERAPTPGGRGPALPLDLPDPLHHVLLVGEAVGRDAPRRTQEPPSPIPGLDALAPRQPCQDVVETIQLPVPRTSVQARILGRRHLPSYGLVPESLLVDVQVQSQLDCSYG